MSDNRRARVQEGPGHPTERVPVGNISWEEHLEAWKVYNQKYHGQSAETIAERGGFGYREITLLLGHEPKTWIQGDIRWGPGVVYEAPEIVVKDDNVDQETRSDST